VHVTRFLISALFLGAAVAQDTSGVPADIQATADRIRTELRIPDSSAPTAAPAGQSAPLITSADEEADAEDSAILLRTMHTVTVDDLVASAPLRDAAEMDAREMLDAAQRMAERGDKEADRVDVLVAHGDAPADASVSRREEAARRHDILDQVTDRAAMLSHSLL
jgi:hypothetical protein